MSTIHGSTTRHNTIQHHQQYTNNLDLGLCKNNELMRITRTQRQLRVQRPGETKPCNVIIPINILSSSTTGRNCTGDVGDYIFFIASTAIVSGPIVLGFLFIDPMLIGSKAEFFSHVLYISPTLSLKIASPLALRVRRISPSVYVPIKR